MKIIKNNIIFIIMLIITLMLGVYVFFSIYFMNHFYFGTYINGINVSCKTIEEASTELEKQSYNYILKLKERNGIIEYIEGSKINLKYDGSNNIESFKNEQNSFLWIKFIFKKNLYNLTNIYSYEKPLLDAEFNKLSCFQGENIIEPVDATLQYDYNSNEYIIVDEVYGNKVNKDYLYAYVLSSIAIGSEEIDLEEINAYECPDFISTSEKVLEAQSQLNKFVSAKIYYDFENEIETVDGSLINQWLAVDQSMNVVFNENKIKEYLKSLSVKYDTYGKTRSFKTTTGKTVEVVGGNYGWKINRSKELNELLQAIKNGETVRKEPSYIQKALGTRENDIGNTYVEINLTNQCLWFYKDGKIIVQGDIVTGNISKGNATPQGTYMLNYKQKGATLKGAGYSSEVKYWMPFNCNIGIHDASWRGTFGGTIYKTDGSHGCVNVPTYLAKKIFENIEPGTPIVCYKEK